MGCKNNQVENTEKKISQEALAEPTASKPVQLSMAKETSYCIIRNISNNGDHLFITVDFILYEWYTVDGIDGRNIVNNNPKLRTFIVDDRTEFAYWIEKGNFEDLLKRHGEFSEGVWHVSVDHGIVLRIEEDTAS